MDYQGVIGIVKSVVICRANGPHLVALTIDHHIDPHLVSGFVAALKMFGEENLGKIKSIHVEGLDVELLIVTRHDLILVAVMDKTFVKEDIRRESENLLDAFMLLYQNELEENCGDQKVFEEFRGVIVSQMHVHVAKLNRIRQESD